MSANLAERLREIAAEHPNTGSVGSRQAAGAYFDHIYQRDAAPATIPAATLARGPGREIEILANPYLLAGYPGPQCHWTQVGIDVWVDGLTGARLTWTVGSPTATLETPEHGGWPR